MADSDITLSIPVVTPAVGHNDITWTVTDPHWNGLIYLSLDLVEVWAADSNDRSAASRVANGGLTGTVHYGVPEETTRYYWARPKNNSGQYGEWSPVGSTAGVACTARGMVGIAVGMANGQITATVASSALTIAVKTAAGSDPSPSNPVFIAFRNANLAGGSYQVRAITAALSLVVSAGSTLGVTGASIPFRLWVVLFDDAGTLRLGVTKATGLNTVNCLVDTALNSSTAEGGIGGADGEGIIYSGAAVTSKPFRILGTLDYESGLAAAGTWSIAPPVIALFGIGSYHPGFVISNSKHMISGQVYNDPAIIPFDLTIPQSSEGISIFDATVAPTSPINQIDVEFLFNIATYVAGTVCIAAFRNSETDAFAVAWGDVPGAGGLTQILLSFLDHPNAGAVTYHFRGGLDRAGGFEAGASGYFGGLLANYISMKEIVC
jgi:hypothetical protein